MQKFRYIIHIQFLGFRFHGWAKQTGLLTVHEMVDKTTRFVLDHEDFKTIGCSRTDSKVSALHFAFELMTPQKCDTLELMELYNKNFPPDIRAIKVEIPDPDFNIISSAKIKDYVYLFACGSKSHPFTAPNLVTFPVELNIELMKEGAAVFQGLHNFKRYCTQPGPNTKTTREITLSRIEENNLFKSSAFPSASYAYSVQSAGFMRNQVRLMMGQLVQLGLGRISVQDLRSSIEANACGPFDYIAPASGLTLYNIQFQTINSQYTN